MIKKCLTLCLLLLSLMGFSQTDGKILLDWEKSAAQHKTIELDFIQKKYSDVFLQPLESRGKLFYMKENYLKWELLEPSSYALIKNPRGIQIINQGNAESIKGVRGQSMKRMMDLIGDLISGSTHNLNQFDIKIIENNTLIVLELIPKTNLLKDVFDKIELQLYPSSFIAKEIYLYDASGDKTQMIFSNAKINQPIDSRIFESTP